MNVTTCPACGRSIDDPSAGQCPHCGATLAAVAPTAETATGGRGADPPPSGSGQSVPFEDRSLPFGTRLLETVKLAFADPVRLFSDMPAGDIGPPLLYGLITGTLGSVLGLAWQMMFGGLFSIIDRRDPIEAFALSTAPLMLFMILSPLFVVVGLFVSTGLYHVALLILGDGQRGFSVTFRAVCYGSTPNLLGVVPLCGGLVGGLWSMVLTIMGGIYGQRTDGWRAILAYFLPLILCCCLAFALISMFGGIAALSER